MLSEFEWLQRTAMTPKPERSAGAMVEMQNNLLNDRVIYWGVAGVCWDSETLCCRGIPQRSWVVTQRCAWYSSILTTPRAPQKPPHPTPALVTDHPGSQERTIWPLHRGPSLWWRWRRDKSEFKGIVGDKACGSASLDTWQMNVMNLT